MQLRKIVRISHTKPDNCKISGSQPLFGPWPMFSKKYPMDHFAVLTPHQQLVETVLHIGQCNQEHVQSRIYGTVCGPLEMPGGTTR